MKQITILSLIIVLLASCKTSQPTFVNTTTEDYDKALADTILAYALDHEALYSLADTLKPISSVKFLNYDIAKDSTMQDGDYDVVTNEGMLQYIEGYQKVCKALSKGDFEFILLPFKFTEKSTRNLEIYVVRKSRLKSILATHATFFGQWGFTPSTNPAVVLTAVEYESRLDRNRAFGYLFGYPNYAVDFFVESTKKHQNDPDKKLVERDFFAIPVFAGNKGYFTYAMPKGHKPTAIDSTIYYKAASTLEKYKSLRDKYNTPQGLQAAKLWGEMNGLTE